MLRRKRNIGSRTFGNRVPHSQRKREFRRGIRQFIDVSKSITTKKSPQFANSCWTARRKAEHVAPRECPECSCTEIESGCRDLSAPRSAAPPTTLSPAQILRRLPRNLPGILTRMDNPHDKWSITRLNRLPCHRSGATEANFRSPQFDFLRNRR